MAESAFEMLTWRTPTDKQTEPLWHRILARIAPNKYVGMFDNDFWSQQELSCLVGQIDLLMHNGQAIKKDITTSVSLIPWNGQNIVVKRYNHKGLIHSLRHTIKRSRARRVWSCANWLRTLQIPTPRPLAYIEHRKAGLVWRSYLLTEYVRAPRLHDVLKDPATDRQKKALVMQQVRRLLDELAKHKITHGDLKPVNVLVSEKGPVLTDLDRMRAHKITWFYRWQRAKDLDLLTRASPGLPTTRAALSCQKNTGC